MSNTSETKNDQAWEALFRKYDILSCIERDGSFKITSEQINQFREARLMTKFDHRSNLPMLFRENNLSILPVTRGNYVISHFDAYQDLISGGEIIKVSFPDHLQSISPDNITSEATALNSAHISGILADFVEDEALLPTVNGRMSSTTFSFNIKNTKSNRLVEVNVENSQIEIDGGYEGLKFLTLIEAKNSISNDFLIRQIYYPFRLWSSKIAKGIKPILLIYTNGVFSLYEYKFTSPNNYNSLILVKHRNYSFKPDDIDLKDLLQVVNLTEIVDEPTVSFPQADSFKRVINLCEILYEKTELTREEITYQYDFDVRQTNYYTDAGRYLGLIDKKRENGSIYYFLTDKGNSLFNLNHKARQLKFVKAILEHRAFNQTLKLYLELASAPPKSKVVAIMKASNLYRVEAESTFQRRASTVLSWVDWILDLQHH
ncbi:MAG: transcriptional regulator [Anaerolineaceae bacterium]|nr:transcriptional regulator [Anaerolineaceae bacterium]MCB9101900.1 transcriptional regulator [Anaerolineales bacterium]